MPRTTCPQRGGRLTHLTEKDLVTVGGVRVHCVYVIPAREGERDEKIRVKTADSHRYSTNHKPISIYSPLLFLPRGRQTPSAKRRLCINFVPNSKKMTINKRRPELFALSDRNSPQRFRAMWRRPGDKSPFVHGERVLRGGGEGWGGRGRRGRVESEGAKSLRAVQVN